MTFSFKSSLIVTLITSQIVFGKINVIAKNEKSEISNLIFSEFWISYDEKQSEVEAHNRYTTEGHYCLHEGEKLMIRINNFYQTSEDSGFYIALDFEKYFKKTSYDNDMIIGNGSEICVFWGFWMPSEDNDNKQQEIYFNILTDQTLIKNGYLFYITTEITRTRLESTLYIKVIESKNNPNSQLASLPEGVIVEIRECKDIKIADKSALLGKETLTHKGKGEFKINLPNDKIEQGNLIKFIDNYTKTHDDKKMYFSVIDWNILQCTIEGFKFPRPFSQILDINAQNLV